MIKALSCCLTLCIIAIGGPADAQPPASRTQSTGEHDVRLSGSDYGEVPSGVAELRRLAGSSGQALLTAIETWVSSQFDLPVIHEHPRIEFALPAKITSLRFRGLLSDPGARTIDPRLLNTTPWRSITTPREPSICQRLDRRHAGRAIRARS
jgi:hypothetical protein